MGAAVVLSGCGGAAGPGQTPTATSAAAPGFTWFRAGPAPMGWKATELPDGTARLSTPPEAAPAESDPASVTAETRSQAGGLVAYFNATPRQGGESLATWPEFRLDHLQDENGEPASRRASATGLAFRGGTGSCVEDAYRSRDRSHEYREIACYVEGARGASVLVVAAPAQDWDAESPILEQAVDSYLAE
ncbi:hypothetical protein SPF06_04725 [Sinomonas sp. JGH33]|uniref:DUF1795 domain-containing protein n=1 Tax=Sinomonas terricola TaxID=3110330 RepID=A0ABU5T2X6_9MICC|nr:hypothetical protein [Sinomonas sp. JGH33]MEA5454022.1 hypothetical protein [Sinomonas sp. JGH33]